MPWLPPPTDPEWMNIEFKRVPIFAWDAAASTTILARTALRELCSVYFLLPGSLVGVAKGQCWRTEHSWLASFPLGENALGLDCVFCLPGLSVWVAILVSLGPFNPPKACTVLCLSCTVHCSFDSMPHGCMLPRMGSTLESPPTGLVCSWSFWCVKCQRPVITFTGLRMAKANHLHLLAACLSPPFSLNELKVGQVFLGDFCKLLKFTLIFELSS